MRDITVGLFGLAFLIVASFAPVLHAADVRLKTLCRERAHLLSNGVPPGFAEQLAQRHAERWSIATLAGWFAGLFTVGWIARPWLSEFFAVLGR
jgi:hypothetical protein